MPTSQVQKMPESPRLPEHQLHAKVEALTHSLDIKTETDSMEHSANFDYLDCMKQPRNFTLLIPSLNQQGTGV